jgi:hypothetical protein
MPSTRGARGWSIQSGFEVVSGHDSLYGRRWWLARSRAMVLLGGHENEWKMIVKNASEETKESLYHSRVEPHIGHLRPRSKSPAAPDHLNQHWTRLGYRLNSISMPLSERCPREQKVRGGYMLHIEVPAHNEWPSEEQRRDRSIDYPRKWRKQGSTATDRWIHPLLTPSVLEHSSISGVRLPLADG